MQLLGVAWYGMAWHQNEKTHFNVAKVFVATQEHIKLWQTQQNFDFPFFGK